MPAGRSETFASARSDPSSMLTSLTPSARSVARSSSSHSRACAGRAQVGLGDDLDQRRAAAVEVDDRELGAVDAPALADVDQLRRVLLEVHAVDAHAGELAAAAERLVVLGDLVALRQVGIEVVLAVEDRARRQLAAERQPDLRPKWIARALTTGSEPGRPRQTGQVCVFGGSPKLSSQPQNIFVAVASWTWISSPMTGS